MNSLPRWLASDDWANLMAALLHTLWVGALVASALFLILRRTVNPVLRHRFCAVALAAVFLGGLLAWAVLEQRGHGTAQSFKQAPMEVGAGRSTTGGAAGVGGVQTTILPGETARAAVARQNQWTAWLGLAWLAGVIVMLGRATNSVAQADRLRRSTRPLADTAILALIDDARRRLGLVRRIRVVVTEKLASPAVLGILTPTLILPLSLLTTMTMGQLQAIVLHELAHVRRGDYLANLFQMLVESLLFFNPAVWWLSRQLRQEREACCDAMAIALAGDHLAYARTLAQVAELALAVTPQPATAFADESNRPGLKDRIERLLVPGYRPGMGLTWKTLVGSVVLGGALLVLSALGTRWTVQAAAALLTPQQRIERIATAMTSLGQPPGSLADENAAPMDVHVRVRTADGSPLPRGFYVQTYSIHNNNGSLGPAHADTNGLYSTRLPPGVFYVFALAKDFAPAFLGPINTYNSSSVDGLELVLERGFPLPIQVVDADSGLPVTGATLSCRYWLPNVTSDVPRLLTNDATGTAVLAHYGPMSLHVLVSRDGYETIEKVVDGLRPGAALQIPIRPGLITAGLVTDKTTGEPLVGAWIYAARAYQAPGIPEFDPMPGGAIPPLAMTDERGQFRITSLPRSGRYWLLARAAGHEEAMTPEVHAGQTGLQFTLGPEVIVRGRVTGDLTLLRRYRGKPYISAQLAYNTPNTPVEGRSYGIIVPVTMDGATGRFEFTNGIAGPAKVVAGDQTFARDAQTSVDDWLITLSAPAPPRTRTVVLRFDRPGGVPPKGTVLVELPLRRQHYQTAREILEIKDGEVRFECEAEGDFWFEPAQTVGYWFASQNVKVPDETGVLVVSVPVTPAGAIYAEARNVDGSLAGDLLFSVMLIERSPLVDPLANTVPGGDNNPGGAPRKFVASPLPLGGTYKIAAYRENNFCASAPISLTEAAPDQKVMLQFSPGVRVEGQVLSPEGRPVARAPVKMSLRLGDNGFGLTDKVTDEQGRFVFEDCNPAGGTFSLEIRQPGTRTSRPEVNLQKLPLTVRLEAGLKAAGRVVEAGTGRPVALAEVRAWDANGKLPAETTRTDEQGQFEFNTLSQAKYRWLVPGREFPNGGPDIVPGTGKPVTLTVKAVPEAGVKSGN